MHRSVVITAVILISGQFAHVSPTAFADNQPLSRISFGSCAKQSQPQPIWEAIVAADPELFLMIGDNIYADTEDMDLLWKHYQMLGAKPGFQKLRQHCPILATWDDHDYGANDAGVEYPKKRESQQLFLDFFEVAKDSPLRKQEGVQSSHLFGPEGRRVQIILLDTRYFRSPLTRGYEPSERNEGFRGNYKGTEDRSTTMLGEAQWKWLENELRKPAEVRVIASSIQVIPDEHGSEKWGNFPHERLRLFHLIRDTKANGVIMISGDRHLAEIMEIDSQRSGNSYPLYEVTSSSLNAPSGNFTKAGTRFANEINSYRLGLTYFDINFGMITIDWTRPDPLIRMRVQDAVGDVVLQKTVPLSRLQPSKSFKLGPADR
ncbi:MAG: alkaline phosphatase D family protein [Planctomycetota bacterium]|nr:alkaline phosphatase D family protein [Planctomycetota bacterium]